MFNFANIDALEFEEICMQILEKKTGKSFRIFGKGPDGGIDIQANDNKKIIGQVKFYLGTTQDKTVDTIKKEINRIKKYGLEIEQYYLFIGRDMSPQSIEEIYEELKPFAQNKENIFTMQEINRLLNEEQYIDIVQQHIKLWMCSVNVMELVNNREIFLDCETLIDNIEKDVKLFVQTDLYDICKKILDRDRLLLILGAPGIGKTITSKMLVLYYAQKGYNIRYSNSQNIEALKKSLSLDKNKKELIFLDDCLGQRYLELHEQRENEILNLIKYIKRQPNKMLLLNSRITIFQEAKNRQYAIGECIDNQNLQIQVIDVENISEIEKARIFHHYLLMKELPQEYWTEIVRDDNYLKIIRDRNYNPRIIDYMTESRNYLNIKPQDYVQAIQNAFRKSAFVWKDEYENKISLEDRIFLITLFSISDREIKEENLKKAFYQRLKKENVDTSIPIFERVLERLNQSFVKIVIKNGERFILAINPGINDFLKNELKDNELEKEKILDSAVFIEQIARILKPQKRYSEYIKEMINQDKFLTLHTNDENSIEEFYLAHILYYDMLDKINRIDLVKTILALSHSYRIGHGYFYHSEILMKIWHSKILTKEQIDEIFYDGKNLSKILYRQSLSEQIEFLYYIYGDETSNIMKNEEDLIEHIEDELIDEYNQYSVSEVANDYAFDDIVSYDVQELINEYEYENDGQWNEAIMKQFKVDLEKKVKKEFTEEYIKINERIVNNLHCDLPQRLYELIECPEFGEWSIDDKEMDEVVQRYINYVYNSHEEDYSYYKKYIYDGHLLKNQTEEEKIIHALFKNQDI